MYVYNFVSAALYSFREINSILMKICLNNNDVRPLPPKKQNKIKMKIKKEKEMK